MTWQDEQLDAWVRLLDYEEGGDPSWRTNPDDPADFRVYDAEGEVVATATSRAAAESIAFALNELADRLDADEEALLPLARARAYVRSIAP